MSVNLGNSLLHTLRGLLGIHLRFNNDATCHNMQGTGEPQNSGNLGLTHRRLARLVLGKFFFHQGGQSHCSLLTKQN